jgi:hypothetical protein
VRIFASVEPNGIMSNFGAITTAVAVLDTMKCDR